MRLASKLIGWDIDIKSEEEKRREIEEQMTALTAPTTPLTALAGVGPKTIEKVEAAGITNVEQLADIAVLMHELGVNVWELFFLVANDRGTRALATTARENEGVIPSAHEVDTVTTRLLTDVAEGPE